MSPNNNAVEARGLVKRYGETTALAGIDLEVPTGTVIAVLGPNGAGKTTAVRILTTLTEPDEGQATVAGYDVRTQGHEVRRRIGLAAQDATVDPLLTGRENLVMLGELHQYRRAQATARADGAARRRSRWTRPPTAGPAGTRAVCAGASTWPPPSSAGPRSSSSTSPPPASTPVVAASCGPSSTPSSAPGPPCVLTTQYLEEAERLADDIVVIDHGRIIARGDARKLKREVGGDQVQVVVVEPAHVPEAARIIEAITGVKPQVDAGARSVAAPTSLGVETLVLVAKEFTAAQIAVDDMSLRQPTLDEVFLTLTGSARRRQRHATRRQP